MSAQMMNMQLQLQSQYQSNQMFSALFNGFGEPAVLPVGVRSRSLSQQRKPLNMFQERRLQLILTAKIAQLFLLTWLTAHRYLMASFSRRWAHLNYFLPCLRNKSQLLPERSFQSDSSYCSGSIYPNEFPIPNSCPEVETSLANEVYSKWFPPRND
ncbi:hypothetical protein DSO57_1026391 [Entomophthora muscae]|uniref:Uncharacterized protein n=1 Tax=Entomophthora muscae TaxID=34485 RepID=A0ACC2SR04_9FUNG|nr:hypothetical protein DSO57_1026391 [Entomophthora muscae]